MLTVFLNLLPFPRWIWLKEAEKFQFPKFESFYFSSKFNVFFFFAVFILMGHWIFFLFYLEKARFDFVVMVFEIKRIKGSLKRSTIKMFHFLKFKFIVVCSIFNWISENSWLMCSNRFKGPGGSMSYVVGLLTTHTRPSPIRRGFVPGFVNYKKGCTRLTAASDKLTSCLSMVGGSLRVLQLLPPLKLVAMILLKVVLKCQNSYQIQQMCCSFYCSRVRGD
jgi:hypothetical protein